MSGDKLFDISDPTRELNPKLHFDSSEDDILNRNYLVRFSKEEGMGDTPELITEEQPPTEILELTSDPDLIYNNNANDRGAEGERTGDEPETTSTQSPQTILDTAIHVLTCDEKDNKDTTTNIKLSEVVDNSQESNTSFLPPLTKSETSADVNISQTSVGTSTSPANEPEISSVINQEEIPDMLKVLPKVSNTPLETINRSYTWKIDERTRSGRRNIEEGALNGKSYTVIKHETKVVPPAVDAPEAEDRKVDASSLTNSLLQPTATTASHFSQSAEESKFSGARSTYFPDNHNEDDVDGGSVCEKGDLAALGKNELSQSSSFKYVLTPEKDRQRKTSQQRSSKSPRLVEVHERKTPVSIKSVNGKPPSPYLCKIFPVVENEKGKKNKESLNLKNTEKPNKFLVSREQNQLLDNNITDFLTQQQLAVLLQTIMNQFKETQAAEEELCAAAMLAHKPKETYMSWLLKGGGEFDPRKNKLRETIATQAISEKVSVHEKGQMTSENDDDNVEDALDENPLIVPQSQDRRINIVSRGVDFRSLVSSMYKSFKVIQAAIHISDYCFFRNEPEVSMKEVVSEPSFQNLMESSNEIEILRNLVTLLSTCKGSVEGYLNSIQQADLAVKEDSCLSKISSGISAKDVQLIWNKSDNALLTTGEIEDLDVASRKESHVVLACPSNSQKAEELTKVSTCGISQTHNRLLPQAHTFIEEQTNVTLSTYFNRSRTLVQSVMCNGFRFQTNLTTSNPHGPIHGIIKSKMEYLGRPTPISLDILLNTIHRCANYIDTRIACSVVWSRQSKLHLLKYIETYLEKSYKPTTELKRWKLWHMERKLKKANVFASIIRNFSQELTDSLTKIHFVILKSLTLLNKLREPELPGFVTDFLLLDEVNLNCSDAEQTATSQDDEPKREVATTTDSSTSMSINVPASVIQFQTLATQQLYKKLVLGAAANPEQRVSVEALIQILALASKSIESVSQLGEQYIPRLGLSKKARRVMRFTNSTSAQLGLSKDVQLGSLVATYLAAIDKLAVFEEFICEQKTDIRAKIHKLCMKITRNLYELRGILCIQHTWSNNLAKNTFMRIKEVNEIRRLRKLKRNEKHINEKIEFLRGSDRSLREAVL
ncbi:unnamed protein product [Orchesella dallaii]|uniref:Uncharacterized protein n=1 Tax=Orchesella dallaii TaxID=48710 RepID=A0ABP1R3U9_9HEXA